MSTPIGSFEPYDVALARHYDEDYAILRSGRGGDPATDVRFYRELARACGGPVLEVACGTGRVALPIARDGHQLTGVDATRRMIEILTDKLADEPEDVRDRVHLYEGRFERLPFGHGDGEQRFPLVYSAFRAFQHLYTPAQKLAGLREMARVLAPGGTLAFDLFDPDPRLIEAYADEHLDYQLQDGDELRERRTRSELVADGTVIRSSTRWLRDGIEVDSARFQMALTRRDELEQLLHEAGLKLHAIYADFEGAEWTPDNPRELVVLARHDHTP